MSERPTDANSPLAAPAMLKLPLNPNQTDLFNPSFQKMLLKLRQMMIPTSKSGVFEPPKTPQPSRKPHIAKSTEFKRSATPRFVPRSVVTDTPLRESEIIVNADPPELNLQEQLEIHRTTELYESRIQRGSDARFLHPALAQRAYKARASTCYSREEIERGERYETQRARNVRPLFWPQRAWDRPEDVMTVQATAALEQRIKTSCATAEDLRQRTPKRSHRKMQRNKESSVVVLSKFEMTDTSDGTDIDEL